ncbi:MAG: hypothetical protein B7Z75_10400 [Acidocella sp. 20-57-95]|nr:MAG: hypothetical protein B7Z75_10400 [Acidocella sp. 20-57-95]OYV61420.1 MAG: hypothetical protein B7Z71_04660 [Acidocella sp. 21-58-7]HQT62984.1 LysR family transcriptional regulator [Acidocella sp.]HQU04367.1 LysR family transcriptional regulator [Acidocella sp.]
MSEPVPRTSLHIRVITHTGVVIGWGRADLLNFIAQTGSIAAAGRKMGMSYKRAWALVEALNVAFETPLVEAAKGGAGGGGAHLTPLGVEVLDCYREIETEAAKAGANALARIAARLKA